MRRRSAFLARFGPGFNSPHLHKIENRRKAVFRTRDFLNKRDVIDFEEENMKGLVASAFDLLHAGHMLMLEDAKRHCDYLVAALQIDPSVTNASYRGKRKQRPLLSLAERKILLSGIRYVDEIIIYADEPDLLEIVKELGPHVRILGSDWRGKYATGQELASEIYYHKRTHHYSTTELRERIRRSRT